MSEMPPRHSEKKVNVFTYDDLWKMVIRLSAKTESMRKKNEPGEEIQHKIDAVVQEWMSVLEQSGRFAAVMDLLPASPLRQTGERLFLAHDGSSLVVLEPHPFRATTGHLDSDIQDPRPQTFFLPPDEADEMRDAWLDRSRIEKLFRRTWRITEPAYGMVPFQINAQAANIELIMDENGQGFRLQPQAVFDKDEGVSLLHEMSHLAGQGIAEVRYQDPSSRQIPQAA